MHKLSKTNQDNKTTYRGVKPADALGWEDQYESVKKRVAMLGASQQWTKLKGILSQSKLFQEYKVLVESHLRYTDVV